MGVPTFNLTNNAELRTLLGKRMLRQMFTANRFANWIAPDFVKAIHAEEEVASLSMGKPKWSGAPVEVQRAFIQEGRTDMLIPIRNRLTALPVFGGTQLFGTGETPAYGFRQVLINRIRKAYSKPTGMEEQKVKQWQANLLSGATEYLQTWLNDFFPMNILSALFNGYSLDLVAPAIAGGRAVAAVSHPNFVTVGHGLVGTSEGTAATNANHYGNVGYPGSAAYEASVSAAIDAITNANTMSVAFIRNLVILAGRSLKIAPTTTKSGFEFYPIFLKDSAYQQLRQDPDFTSLVKSLHIKDLEEHPLANSAVCFIEGAAIYTDSKLWCARTHAIDANVTANTVEYGPAPTAAERGAGFVVGNSIAAFDTGNIAMGCLIGQSMLTVGIGKNVEFTEQTADHDNIVEIGVDMIQSVVRNETYDTLGLITGTANRFYENTSSIVFASYSPYNLNW